jgi:hypothetical protein
MASVTDDVALAVVSYGPAGHSAERFGGRCKDLDNRE